MHMNYKLCIFNLFYKWIKNICYFDCSYWNNKYINDERDLDNKN